MPFWMRIVPDFFLRLFRDAPEATGEEADDADFDMPKIYEPVWATDWFKLI